jgi:hypothetical protein
MTNCLRYLSFQFKSSRLHPKFYVVEFFLGFFGGGGRRGERILAENRQLFM